MAKWQNILLSEKPIEPLDAYLAAGAALVKGPALPRETIIANLLPSPYPL